MHEGTVLMRCFSLEHAGDHLQTGIPQTLNATTSYTGIRIFECHNHALNAGLNHRLRTGRRAALMAAGLERNDDRAALGAPTGLGKGTHLGMGLTGFGVKALTRQRSLSIQHHGTHKRIGARLAFS
jgi:hypothetical protein